MLPIDLGLCHSITHECIEHTDVASAIQVNEFMNMQLHMIFRFYVTSCNWIPYNLRGCHKIKIQNISTQLGEGWCTPNIDQHCIYVSRPLYDIKMMN